MATYEDPQTGRQIRQPFRENTEYAAFSVRIIRSMARRAAGDPDVLPALREIRALVDDLTTEAVQQCRREGYSWQDIADRIGTTRQGAQKKYGRTDATNG